MKVVFASLIASTLVLPYLANASQGTAKAKVTVVNSVSVIQASDLLFSEAANGAAAETVAADSYETAQNASFNISGEANRGITVTLPQNGDVVMKVNGGGSSDNEISVYDFTSNTPTQLDGGGQTQLYVGATRAALSPTQTVGEYEADFVVDVIYQ